MLYMPNTRLVKELNDDWQKFVEENKLAVLIKSGEQGVYLLKHLSFEKPVFIETSFTLFESGFEIKCRYSGKRTNNPNEFKLGAYEINSMSTNWIINNEYGKKAESIQNYFYDFGFDDEQHIGLKETLNQFNFKDWVNDFYQKPIY